MSQGHSQFQRSTHPEDWDGAERRAGCVVPAPNFEQYLHNQLERQAVTFAKQLEDSVARIEELLKSSVPEGDLESHRRAHVVWIEEAERRNKFRDAVIEKTLSSLVLAGLIAGGTLILSGGLKKIGIDWPTK